ncbi:MAG: dipeptidase [Patescibacteria group bacterium]|nr:dipeptidase [Patescibacteria group bacterium]
MTIFLTSTGFSTETLKSTFLSLLTKPLGEIKVAFIDTASKVEKNTDYVDKDLEVLKSMGLKNVSRIDISEPQDNWIKILIQADIFYVEGGNTFYLLDKLRSSGLDKSLPRIIQNKIYVGVSAGSIVATPTIAIATVEPSDPNTVKMTDFTGLHIVDFEVSPHTPDSVPLKNVEKYAKKANNKIHAFDDQSALLVIDNTITVIGEGFNKIYD